MNGSPDNPPDLLSLLAEWWAGRLSWWREGTEKGESFDFQELVRREESWLDGARDVALGDEPPPWARERGSQGEPHVISPQGKEPWVAWTPKDRFGLALSGGGMRSATFNLGLLQALGRHTEADHDSNAKCTILDCVDYVSTVSGGGYVGGFWSTWLHAHGRPAGHAPSFPSASPGRPEAPEVLHLRERSRFLVPRLGLFEAQTWAGVVALIGGMIPSAIVSAALLVLLWFAWLTTAYALYWHGLLGPATVALSALVLFVVAEDAWRARRYMRAPEPAWMYRVFALACAGFAGVCWYAVSWLMGVPRQWRELVERWPSGGSKISESIRELSVGDPTMVFLLPTLPWLCLAAVLLLLFRPLGSRFWSADMNRAIERTASRCLIAAMLWALMAVLWIAALRTPEIDAALPTAIGGTAFGSGLFLSVRKWLTSVSRPASGAGIMERVSAALKPALPQILAFLVAFGMVWSVALLVMAVGRLPNTPVVGFERDINWAGVTLGVAALALVAALVVIDTHSIGLHEFYRSRIEATFLAAGFRAAPNRRETASCDVTFRQLRDGAGRAGPIHLVCATANDLSSDPLPTLYRGGRSVTLSPIAVSLGDAAAEYDSLRLSSALTASAAAFNSHMGSASKRLGPTVAFIMSTLGLRLGLWLRHPASRPSPSLLPGWNLFKEMAGVSNAPLVRGGRERRARARARELGTWREAESEFAAAKARWGAAQEARTAAAKASEPPPPAEEENIEQEQALYESARAAWNSAREAWEASEGQRERDESATVGDLHLSDGGHFENLALYELVRRHCRYIVVSDCGADAELAFDDLANATRRIREDFGVEIELDVRPLRPGSDGLSRQHVVVGTIHYDGIRGMDKGVILYFKPTLVGDEPTDVTQYRTRNSSFPHESTGDQFYDEAQWESYRRLGEHCAGVVFRFLENGGLRRDADPVERLFLDVSDRWQHVVGTDDAALAALAQERDELLESIRADAPPRFRAELFPDVASATSGGASGSGEHLSTMKRGDDIESVYYCARIASLMDRVWRAASLETNWAHPSVATWMSHFHRFAGAPTFRRWWVLLRPLCGSGFRDFVKQRFGIRVTDPTARPSELGLSAEVTLRLVPGVERAAALAAMQPWQYAACDAEATTCYVYRAKFDPMSRGDGVPVGIVACRRTDDRLSWCSGDFYVPASLDGAGISSRMLDALIAHHATAGDVSALEVRIVDGDGRGGNASQAERRLLADPAHRQARTHALHFYKSRGFVQRSEDRRWVLYKDLVAERRVRERATSVAPAGRASGA